MNNIIQNAQWFATADETPGYFTNTGFLTFDDCCIQNHRTCSCSMSDESTSIAINAYDPMIPLCEQQRIVWGYCMRAIEVQHVSLQAEFFDANQQSMGIQKECISSEITTEFQDVATAFDIPQNAFYVRLSLVIEGKTTALTIFAPFAYFTCEYDCSCTE